MRALRPLLAVAVAVADQAVEMAAVEEEAVHRHRGVRRLVAAVEEAAVEVTALHNGVLAGFLEDLLRLAVWTTPWRAVCG